MSAGGRTPVRAAVLSAAPGRLEVEELLLDDLLEPDEVQVAVAQPA